MTRPSYLAALALLAWAASASADGPSPSARKVDFGRDVRPILSDACFACHGPDKKTRKGGLRLDVFDSKLRSNKIIVPNKAAESELYQRLVSDEPTKKMPPPKHPKKLTPEQIALLKRWIDEGA